MNLLLAHWENRLVRDLRAGSTVEAGQVLQLDLRIDVLRAALERVAFDAHERRERQSERSESAADVPADDLLHALDEQLGSLDEARRVVTYLQQRAGLLQAVDGRTYRFPHRTFQEYLAARHLIKQPECDEMLRDRVRRDLAWWREVFLLAAGASRETPRNISNLVDELIPQPPGGNVSAAEAERARLAAQALEETRFVEAVEKATEPGRFAATWGKVRAWLAAALSAVDSLEPAERASCGRSLASLGDPRSEVITLEGMEFCLVPAGDFWMGSDEGYTDEKPLHPVAHLTHDYWIARYPVTTAQVREYAAAGNELGDLDALKGAGNEPAVWISYHEARAFCGWLTETWRSRDLLPEGWVVRLPTEAEWEKAARGGLETPAEPVIRRAREAQSVDPAGDPRPNPEPKREHPWPGDFEPNRCNSRESGIRQRSALGCFPNGRSPYGCEEMAGNVWEWTRSQPKDYPYDLADGREDDEETASRRVLRGGSFSFVRDYARCAARLVSDPSARYVSFGFRVVLSPSGL